MKAKKNMSDGTAKLISDSILVVLVQMRGQDYSDIAKGITARITTLTGGEKWNCIIGERGRCNWDNRSVTSILCETDNLSLLLHRQT